MRDPPAQKELESARAAWLSSAGARHGAEVSDAGTFIVPAASLQVSRFIPTSFSVIFFNSVLSSSSLPCVIVSLELVQSKKNPNSQERISRDFLNIQTVASFCYFLYVCSRSYMHFFFYFKNTRNPIKGINDTQPFYPQTRSGRDPYGSTLVSACASARVCAAMLP